MNTPFKKRESPLTINSEDRSDRRGVSSFKRSVANPPKEKYTAVMDKELRVRIKIASAKKNIQLSRFIEEAVLEKLEREGL